MKEVECKKEKEVGWGERVKLNIFHFLGGARKTKNQRRPPTKFPLDGCTA